MQIQIDVTSDVICPWCYIGEKRLIRAIESLPAGIDVQLEWLPFELSLDMPPEGMDRRTYRSRKFGAFPGDGRPDRALREGRRSRLRL
jgi:predicted DsbA family dithiol-disulfide isomerase